jgi:hypothetical protein
MRVTERVNAVADRLGKHPATIWRWIQRGCDIDSEQSINRFWDGNHRKRKGLRQQNPKRIRKPKRVSEVKHPESAVSDLDRVELGPIRRRGAAAALERLEEIEERAHARLIQAIGTGNQFEIKAAQEFYLRSSESLRRLDLAVETERRKADDQVPMWLVKDISLQIATWLRAAFEQFLSSESSDLMAIADLGEFKFLATERFRGILHKEVKASLKTEPPIPDWAETQIREAWNIL